MPTAPQYNGIPSLITQAAGKSIASSTNATPIVVTTTTPHGLTEGDVVKISGHTTNTAANGMWKVHVLSTTTFALLDPLTGANTTGNGVGGATGIVLLYTSGTYAILADGIPRDAASYNVALETLGDRTAYTLAKLFGSLQLADWHKNEVADDTWTSWSSTSVGTSWTVLASVDAFITPAGDADVVPNDWLDLEFTSSCSVAAGTGGMGFSLFAHLYDYGASPSFASSTRVPGSGVLFANGVTAPLRLRSFISTGSLPSPLFRGKALRLYVAGKSLDIVARTATLTGDRAVSVKVLRG